MWSAFVSTRLASCPPSAACSPLSGLGDKCLCVAAVNQGWIFFRREYFLGMNFFQGGIFFRDEYFFGVNIARLSGLGDKCLGVAAVNQGWIFFKKWIFFRGDYFSGVNIACLSLAWETNASVWLLSITGQALHHPQHNKHGASRLHPRELSGIWYPSNPYPNLASSPPSVRNFSFSQQKL